MNIEYNRQMLRKLVRGGHRKHELSDGIGLEQVVGIESTFTRDRLFKTAMYK
jgi:hypothetical protein